MKPGDSLNNLSQVPCGAPLGSTTENNSFSSDSDMEVAGGGAGDQRRIIQRLQRTIKSNQTKINDLTANLKLAENNLSCEKERTKDKEDVIKSLKLSIDLITQNKDLSIKCMQSQLNELQTALDSSKTQNVTKESGRYKTKIDELKADIEILESKLKNRNDTLSELDDKRKQYENDLREKDKYIAKLESQTQLSLETTQKMEDDLREQDELIAKLKSQTKLYLETTESDLKEKYDMESQTLLSLETAQKYECDIKGKDERIAKLEAQIKLYLEETESDLREKDELYAKLESQTQLSLETTQKYERDLREKDEHIAKLKFQTMLSLETTQLIENDLREQDELIAKLKSQTKSYLETTESDLREEDDMESQTKLSPETTQKYESDLKEKDDHIAKLESQTKLFLETTENDLREKDERIAKLETQRKLYLIRDQQYGSLVREQDDQIAKLESRLKTDAAKMNKMEDKLVQLTRKTQTSPNGISLKYVELPKSGRCLALFAGTPSTGPGWMVIQCRIDGSAETHTRKYNIEYYKGFGDVFSISDLNSDFWFGCYKLHELTTSRRHELYVELVNLDDETAFARYDHFVVGSRKESFRLQSLGEYSGDAGDYLRKCQAYQIDAQKFECDKRTSYGWWHSTERNLIGKFYDDNIIRWGRWSMGRGQKRLKSCKMLIRPTDYWMD